MGKQKVVKKSSNGSLAPSDFVHLHNHTHHSLLDGLTKIPDLVKRSKELGMNAAAVTDHGTMSGCLEFYKEATSNGFKPILGIETYVAARSRHDRDPAKDKRRFHLILLAMDNQGYKNLMKLASLAELEGKYYKPRIDHELLEKYNQGIIALSGCASSEIGEALKNGDYKTAKDIAFWYKKVFGDRYYLELQDHGHPDAPSHWPVQATINEGLMKLAQECGLLAVVTCDGHYLSHDDQEAHEILLCVGTVSYLSDEKRMSLKDFELHLTDPRDIIARWGKTFPQAVENTRRIADRCDVTIELGKILIPKYPTPDGESEKDYLERLVWRGLLYRYGGKSKQDAAHSNAEKVKKILSQEIIERTEYELKVMDSMGYNGYFLIVQDFINWGKDRGIIFGPGRGSAAGSIVSYALSITEIDPMKYSLMFERFLNPSRISMPDIDIDIQDTRRDEVIRYCANKYGDARVANIVTFGKMAARAAVRDVARVLQVPYGESDRLSKMIPPPVQGRHIPLEKSIQQDADLKREYESNSTAKQVFDYAIRLEGTIRSHGVHAAGVVIAPDDIVNYVPLEMTQKGVVATQYPMGPVEELGLLKMDFLGLSNLTIIKNALRIIKKAYQEELSLGAIPANDDETLALFRRGDTTGVFQFESAGMKRYLKELQPNEFSDLVAMNALYRPGPMSEIPRFIAGKNDPSSILYLHESLEPILSETYGVMVYQEQIINLLQLIAGYTPGEADLVRKAIGKKKRDIMQAEEPKFIAGCLKQGLSRTAAEKLWAQIQPFADYSFNKAHATCYSQIAYWTAYLKAHYPDAFMAALMTSDQDDTDRLAIEMAECKHMGISVLGPEVNQSYVEFAVVPNNKQIRFGMAAVKGVGVGAVEEILRARETGEFTSVEDFATRVSNTKVNKKSWESLIKTGAFDKFVDRSDLLYNLEDILSFASKLQKEKLSGQADLFGELSDDSSIRARLTLQSAPAKYTMKEQLSWERELLGIYLSAHPLDSFELFLHEQTISLAKLTPEIDGQHVTVGGLVTTVRTIVTKNGKKMAFIGLEDKTNEGEIIVFPNLYETLGDQLRQDTIIKAAGKISARDKDGTLGSEAKLIADEISILDEKNLRSYESTGNAMKAPENRAPYRKKVSKNASAAKASVVPAVSLAPPQALYLRVEDPSNTDVLLALKASCAEFPGDSMVVLVIGTEIDKKALRMPFKVTVEQELIKRLTEIISSDHVILK